jgi:hypothetical protein
MIIIEKTCVYHDNLGHVMRFFRMDNKPVRREILGVNFILTVLIDVLGNTKAKREVCIGVL